jgi:hypothetical protein
LGKPDSEIAKFGPRLAEHGAPGRIAFSGGGAAYGSRGRLRAEYAPPLPGEEKANEGRSVGRKIPQKTTNNAVISLKTQGHPLEFRAKGALLNRQRRPCEPAKRPFSGPEPAWPSRFRHSRQRAQRLEILHDFGDERSGEILRQAAERRLVFFELPRRRRVNLVLLAEDVIGIREENFL